MAGHPGVRNSRWRGGKVLTEKGYIRYKAAPHRDRFEHHVVLEQKLGRAMLADHECHHVDGAPWNNDPGNLEEQPSLVHRSYSGKRSKGQGSNGHGSNGARAPWNMSQAEYQQYIVSRGVSVPPSVRKLMNVAPF